MVQVSLDTSFLISLADPARAHHQIAVAYYRYFVENRIPMYLSTIAAGEFEVGQPLESLPLQNFRVQTYNLFHAKRSAHLFRINRQHSLPVPDGSRSCVVNDLKILAQAVEESVSFIMTEDRNTLAKITTRLQNLGLIVVEPRLLIDGFAPLGSVGVQGVFEELGGEGQQGVRDEEEV